MNKKNLVIVGLLLFISTVLSGCVSNSIDGTYLHGYESLIIYSDNTFVLKDLKNGIDYSGVVRQQKDGYVFTSTLLSFTGKMVDGNMSTDGGIYVKQR